MLSINTNLSSLIVQTNLKQSTNALNRAIERMTTGFKINGAKDNAAGYSISTSMSSKISAYQVAEDNASKGLDLISTASETLAQINDKLTRIRALQEQANNGTYGEDSLAAIQAEVNVLVDEIQRLYDTTEYNGINLFMGVEEGGGELTADLLVKIKPRDTSKMTSLASVDETQKIDSGTYSISTAEELAKLATMTNNGLVGKDTEFVLANNIDLSAYSSGTGWTTIGNTTNSFQATFDGNGHVISNLYINDPDGVGGLFRYAASIKNLGLENVDVTSKYASALARSATTVSNCYVTGSVNALGNDLNYRIGLLVGSCRNMDHCYSMGEVQANNLSVAGLAGDVDNGQISNCYSTADAYSGNYSAAGLVAYLNYGATMTNCFAIGNAESRNKNSDGSVGGLVGATFRDAKISNCYSTGKVTGSRYYAGSLVGYCSNTTITDSYALSPLTSSARDKGIFGGGSTDSSTFKDCFYLQSLKDQGLDFGGVAGFTAENLQAYSGPVPFAAEDLVVIPPMEDTKVYTDVNFQVGINSSESSQINVSIAFSMSGLSALKSINSPDNLEKIDAMIQKVSAKQTEFGSAQNRLESALEEISTQYENLVSSRSTLRDADITKESSAYIRNQILQQASATLLATANQSPSIAIQLL